VVGELKNTKGREEEREKELVAELGVVTTCSSEIRFLGGGGESAECTTDERRAVASKKSVVPGKKGTTRKYHRCCDGVSFGLVGSKP